MRIFGWAGPNNSTMVRRESHRWGPFEVMAEVARRDAFHSLAARLWRNEARMTGFAPAFDVRETRDSYIFKGDLPGFHDRDLEIRLAGHELVVTGHREPEHMQDLDRYHFAERAHGTFTRSFRLPEQITHEQIQAELRDGVLTIQVPKSVEARRISVRSTERKEAKA